MRVHAYFLAVVVGIILFLPGVAEAGSNCSFSYNTSIISGYTEGYKFEVSMQYLYYTGYDFSFRISNAQYLPTYLYASSSNPNPGLGLVIYYYPVINGVCSSWYRDAASNVGMSGVVKIEEDDKVIGSWVYYKRPDRIEFYASYDVDGIKEGKIKPFGKTIVYEPNYFAQYEAQDCGIAGIDLKVGDYYVGNPPSDPKAFLLTMLQTARGPVIYTVPMMPYGSGEIRAIVSALGVKLVNITITHDPYSNIFLVNVSNGFDGNLILTTPTGSTYSYPFVANRNIQLFIPHYSNEMDIVDSYGIGVLNLNLEQKLGSCLNPNLVGLKKLALADKAGNRIMDFSIVLNGQEYSSTGGYINVPELIDQPITVIPFKRYDLQFNTTVSTQEDTTVITAPFYVYTVQVAVRQQGLTGDPTPASFTYTIRGEEYANKTELTNPDFRKEGAGYDNITVYLLPGNYQLTLRTATLIFTRENSTNLTLFDDRYYRKIVWTAGLLSDSFSETALTSPLLSVLVIDQNSTPVSNAEVQLYDSTDSMIAANITKNDGHVFFYVMPGQNYTLKVFYAKNLKAVKSFQFPENETTLHITVPISITPEEIHQAQQTGMPSSTAEMTGWVAGLLINPVFIALLFILLMGGGVAAVGGTEMGLIAVVAGIAIFTFIVPILPVQILAVIGVAAGVLFGLRLVRK
jgi:hypothetical protein